MHEAHHCLHAWPLHGLFWCAAVCMHDLCMGSAGVQLVPCMKLVTVLMHGLGMVTAGVPLSVCMTPLHRPRALSGCSIIQLRNTKLVPTRHECCH